jgi:hypothetical protein
VRSDDCVAQLGDGNAVADATAEDVRVVDAVADLRPEFESLEEAEGETAGVPLAAGVGDAAAEQE